MCTRKYRHIDIRFIFVEDGSESSNMSISYCSTEHIIADLFTEVLQGALFVKTFEVIMGWKHVDTLHIQPPSTKELVGNVVETESSKGKV